MVIKTTPNKERGVLYLAVFNADDDATTKSLDAHFSIGQVVTPDSFISELRNFVRQFYTHDSRRSGLQIEESKPDQIGEQRTHGSLLWTGTKFKIKPIYLFDGYLVHCGLGPAKSIYVTPQQVFQSTGFDWVTNRAIHYSKRIQTFDQDNDRLQAGERTLLATGRPESTATQTAEIKPKQKTTKNQS
ncbi:hypothetical protein N7456_001242 [Penicillium angulare]|uniref:Uncharacterized protein n=1 Tax=Penicillium angulare TaxID=116970 RepID=A0A9W9GDJ5_9EURO|nr:hypothetical protein N7456_001242 [Penicillium angulare]